MAECIYQCLAQSLFSIDNTILNFLQFKHILPICLQSFIFTPPLVILFINISDAFFHHLIGNLPCVRQYGLVLKCQHCIDVIAPKTHCEITTLFYT